MESLSAREGLGSKHGAPRRAVQEELRTAVGILWTAVGNLGQACGEFETMLTAILTEPAPATPPMLHQHPQAPQPTPF